MFGNMKFLQGKDKVFGGWEVDFNLFHSEVLTLQNRAISATFTRTYPVAKNTPNTGFT